MTKQKSKQYIIGVDIGGTKISTAIADLKGKIITENITPTMAKKGANPVATKIVSSINNILKETKTDLKSIKNIVLGIPGHIDQKTGIIIHAPNIKGWKNYNLIEKIASHFKGVTIILENDANCATMGEFMFGAGQKFSNVVFLTISTGIGGGIIIDQKLYQGKNGIAGEIGHMILNLKSDEIVECSCGRIGCFEAYASGTSMAKRARKKLKEIEFIKNDYGTTVLNLAERNFNKITSVIIGQAAKLGDQFAIDIIKENAQLIGVGCANLINLLDPEAIIIGGGVSQIGDLLFNTIRKSVKQNIKMTDNLTTEIIPAAVGTKAGILGAIAIGMSL